MTTTPTIWKSAFSPNPAAQAGIQSVPQTIGLANGNILVVWEDNTDATRPFIDIIGQILSPEGEEIGPAFQVNAAIWGGDETGPEIVALPDGGFVMAYGGYFEALGGFITVERFNSAGQTLFNNVITDPYSSLTDWKIAADGAGNYTVTLERIVVPAGSLFGSIDIHSITYDFATNARGTERSNAAQNSAENDRLGATAAFADGRIVTFYTEPDDWLFSYLPPLWVTGNTFEFTITNPLTGATVRGPTEIADPEGRVTGRAQDVAILTGGQIVLLYSQESTNKFLAMKIVANGGASGGIGPEIVVDPDFSLEGDNFRSFENARAVALQDGGFLIAWVSGVFLYASRRDAAGAPIGSQFIVDQNLASGQTALFDLSLTADGRVLIPFIRETGEVAEAIVDPRDNVIIGTEVGETITTQITSTQIFGLGGSDTILGQGGDDNINGGLGLDFLHGGGGDDAFHLDDMTRLGQIPTYIFYDEVIEKLNGGTDTIYVQPFSGVVNYLTLAANVENGIVDGVDDFDLSGNDLANTLTGNFGANELSGFSGRDALIGGGGGDTLRGGVGNDTLDGGIGNDILAGGGGNDRLAGRAGVDRMAGGVGSDTFAFADLADSGVSIGLRDTITDFITNPAAGAAFIDRISVPSIDAMAGAGGNQAFTFIKAAAFSAEGQVRAFQSRDNTVVQFNTIGAGGAEMAIVLLDFTATALSASDFVL